MAGTKEKILDAAERLFAAQGFAATSLRQIIAQAGVNLAAVHYHFGSKDGLLDAVFARRIEPVNRERLELLDRYEAAGDPTLEQILEALIVPTIALARHPERRVFIKVMARMLMEPESRALMLAPHFEGLLQRFQRALRRALPELPEIELLWRVHFAIGAIAHTMLGAEKLEMYSQGRYKPQPGEPVLERLVTFLAAGFRAPVTEAPDAR
jgi:AcrR family transcriptional regulator